MSQKLSGVVYSTFGLICTAFYLSDGSGQRVATQWREPPSSATGTGCRPTSQTWSIASDSRRTSTGRFAPARSEIQQPLFLWSHSPCFRHLFDLCCDVWPPQGSVELGGVAPSPLSAVGTEVKTEPVNTQVNMVQLQRSALR